MALHPSTVVHRVPQAHLNDLYNNGPYDQQLASAELRPVVKSQGLAPASAGQPDGTLSQILELIDKNGKRVAILHQYRLPDGRIGASGRPSPKMLINRLKRGLNQLANRPDVIGHAKRYRGRTAQRLVHAAEVVVRDPEGNRGAMVRQLLAVAAGMGIAEGGGKGGARKIVRLLYGLREKGLEIGDLIARANSPIRFIPPHGGNPADGYEATILPDICAVVIEAGRRGLLHRWCGSFDIIGTPARTYGSFSSFSAHST